MSKFTYASENKTELFNETNTYNYDENHETNNSYYDMSKRNTNQVDEDVLLTIFTPGLGGDGSHFSGIKKEDDDYEFGYEENTIIDSLSKMYDNNVRIKFIRIDEDVIDDNSDKTNEFNSNYEYYENNHHTLLIFETEQPYNLNDYVYSMNFHNNFNVLQLTDIHWNNNSSTTDSKQYLEKLFNEVDKHLKATQGNNAKID